MTHHAHAHALEYAAIVLIVLALLSILNPVRWIDAILRYVAGGVGGL